MLRSHHILLFLLLGIHLFAQEEDSIAYAIDLDDYIVTAQYKPTHYTNALFDVDIISKELIASRGATQLDQALQTQTNIRLAQDFVLGTQVRMNGLGANNVAILIDGIPVIGRNDGAIDISQISTQNIERIEIVNGPLSNIYGNNAAAGVINIITKNSQLNPWAVDFNYQLESIGIQNYDLNVGFQRKKLRLSAHGRYYDYDEYPVDSLRVEEDILLDDGTTVSRTKYPWNPKEQYGVGGSAAYSIDNNNKLTLKYDYNNEDVTDYGPVNRTQFMPYAWDNLYNTVRKDLALLYDGLLLSDYDIDFSLGLNQYDRKNENNYIFLETNELNVEASSISATKFETWFSRLNATRAFGEQWEFLIGAAYNNETGEGDRLYDPSREDPQSAEYTESAFFTELKYSPLKNLLLSGSVRFINHSNYSSEITPAFHLKYDFLSLWSLRTSYAQGYRNPTLKELYHQFVDVNHHILGNPDLSPELSDDLRATVQYSSSSGLIAEGTAYKTSIKDKIELFSLGEGIMRSYDNVDQYDVYGGSLSLTYKIDELTASVATNLSYWDAEIDAAESLSKREVFDMNLSAAYTLPKLDIGLSSNYRLTGKEPFYRINEDRQVQVSTVESVSFLDFSMNRSFWKDRFTLVLGVKNLLDITDANINGAATGGGAHSSSANSRIVSQGRSWYFNFSFNL